MLRHIHIENVALLESASLDPQSGMTAITGETGSGKSLLIDTFSLLAGTRASPSLVRTGADRATVEAIFDAPPNSPVLQLLSRLGLEPLEAGEIILRREVHSSGRSRAAINGRLVPLGQLSEVANLLMDIGGQHEQQQLLEHSAQRDLYDAFAGAGALRDRVAESYKRLMEATRELENLRTGERELIQRREFLRFQVAELEEANLVDGEQAKLEEEIRRLGNLGAIRTAGEKARAALAEGGEELPAAIDLIGAALSALEDAAELDSSFAPSVDELRELQSRVADVSYDISRNLDRCEEGPDSVDDLIARAETIRKILRKYGSTERDVITELERLRAELGNSENPESAFERLEAEVLSARKQLFAAASELGSLRAKSKKRFLTPLVAMLKDFALGSVRAELEFRPARNGIDIEGRSCTAFGFEEIEILFSANAGEAPQPLRRVASGGELSRIMLALRTIEAETQGVPFMVFDEIDAGISGTAARKVAERISALSKRCQVYCVTHNPSVASAADHHLVARKEEQEGRTSTALEFVLGLRREEELARLLDGGKRSRKGMALAAEMLERTG